MRPLDEIAREIAVMKWRGEDRVHAVHCVLYEHTVDIFIQIRNALTPESDADAHALNWLATQLERLATQIPKPERPEHGGQPKTSRLPTE